MNLNFYKAAECPDRADAEIQLAKLWTQSARAEKHVKRLPAKTPVQMKPGVCRKVGVLDAVRAYAANSTRPFTRNDLAQDMPQFSKSQLTSALSNASDNGIIVAVGKAEINLNVYAAVRA